MSQVIGLNGLIYVSKMTIPLKCAAFYRRENPTHLVHFSLGFLFIIYFKNETNSLYSILQKMTV